MNPRIRGRLGGCFFVAHAAAISTRAAGRAGWVGGQEGLFSLGSQGADGETLSPTHMLLVRVFPPTHLVACLQAPGFIFEAGPVSQWGKDCSSVPQSASMACRRSQASPDYKGPERDGLRSHRQR